MSSYLLLNKPKGVISSTRRGTGRRTVLDFIPFSLQREQRWYAVGLLDGDSTGLVLLTDDGELERVAIGPLRSIGLKPGTAKLLGKREIEKLRASMLSA